MRTIHLQHGTSGHKVIRCNKQFEKAKRLAAFLIVDVTDMSSEPIYAKYRQRVASTLAASWWNLFGSWRSRLKRWKETGDLYGSLSSGFGRGCTQLVA
jgi:hypothetical protein